MHTGYDSFWMYQNNRQEHVLNLPKNDNYSQGVLTDSYKQVQNGGHPSHLNSYVPPQNNVARSYPNDQQRTQGSQHMWPYSFCSMPLKSSYASNFQPQAAFSNQCNNSGYSPQYPQARSDLSNFKSPNTSYTHCQNTGSSVPTGDNQNTNTQAPRIRVRDVYSLNKSSISSEVLNSSSYQIQQKQQHGYALNFATNVSCNNENQSQFINYDRRNLPPSHCPAPYYHPEGMEQHQQSLQNSTAFYQNTEVQQNPERQHEVGTNRPLDRNLHLGASKIVTQQTPLLEKLLHPANNQDPKVQNERRNSSESMNGSKRAKVLPNRNSVQINLQRSDNLGYGDSYNKRLAQESSNVGSYTQIQSQQPEIGEVSSFRNNSTVPAPVVTTSGSTRSPGYQQSGGEENTIIKISIPHSGQSTYVTLSDCGSTNKSSNLSLPCLLESNDKFSIGWSKNNTICNSNDTAENRVAKVSRPQISEANLNSAQTLSNINNAINTSANPAKNCHNSESKYPEKLNSPLRKRFCQVKEAFLDLNRENLNEFLNSTSEINSRRKGNENSANETDFQHDIALRLKQENFNARVESQESNISESVPIEKVLFEVIKTEKNHADENAVAHEDETKPSTNNLEDSFTQVTKFNGIDFKETVFSCEISQSENVVENSERCIRQVQNVEYKSNDKRNNSQTEMSQKIVSSERNYQSKINRDKLDKLIQFLEKDEQPVQNNLPVRKHPKSEVDLNHNRRKLSKTCIVKNKNNSREMISMKSNKSDRKACSDDDRSKTGENRNGSEKQVKSNSSRDTQIQEEGSGKSQGKNFDSSASKQFEIERPCVRSCGVEKEENVMNKIRALQISETVFCRNCDLIATLDSFWINVASGEVRCLNCFKKILLKSEEIASKLISNDMNNSEGNSCQKSGRESGSNNESGIERNSESILKDTNRENVLKISMAERLDHNSSHLRKETMESPKSSRRQSTSEDKTSEQRKRGDAESFSHKIKHSEDVSKPKRKDSVTKDNATPPRSSIWTGPKQSSDTFEKSDKKCSEKWKQKDGSVLLRVCLENLRKDQLPDQALRKGTSKEHISNSKKDTDMLRKSISREEEMAEENAKKDKRGAECSNQSRRKSDSKEVSNKFPEENSKKDAKTVTELTEKSFKKVSQKDNAEKERTQSPAKESCTCYRQKESNSSEELTAKNTCSASSVEKQKRTESFVQPRKRKHSDDDIGSGKVRVVEEQTKKEIKSAPHRTNLSSGSKEDMAKHRNKVIENETQSIKISTDKFRRSSLSKDGDNSKKEPKQDSLSNSKVKETLKGDTTHQKNDSTKQKTDDSLATLRRKSKEEQVTHKQTKNETRQVPDMFERTKSNSKERSPKSHVEDLHKVKHGSVTTENKERIRTEEKEKYHFSGKEPRKSETPSGLLKENQNTKTRNSTTENGKLKPKDLYEERNEHRKNDCKKPRVKETTDKKAKMEVESNSDQKKYSDRLDGKCDKSQTENRHAKSSDKEHACRSGGKMEDEALTKVKTGKESATLLAKLIKKTKKLSRSLLSDA